MNRRDVHRFDRLHQVRAVEEQRARQVLVAAHDALRQASQVRDAARAGAGLLPASGVRDLGVFRREVDAAEQRVQELRTAQAAVQQAETAVVDAHGRWMVAARRAQGLEKLVAHRREAAAAEQLKTDAAELEDLFLARRAVASA
jgi:flagellar biosynthesis chaperone FliJ